MRAPVLTLADVVPGKQLDALLRTLRPADTGAESTLVALAAHPRAGVRSTLAQRLPLMAHGAGGPALALVEAVVRLTSDEHPGVRESACFALGTLWRDLPHPCVDDALAARLDDEPEVRDEALLGLAHRQDPRALPAVRRVLGEPVGLVSRLVLEAAGALGDTDLHPLVVAHAGDEDAWDADDLDVVDAAVRLTDPAGLGDDVLDGVADLCRAGAAGRPPGRSVAAWEVLDGVLDVAPRRARQALEAVAARLVGEPEALVHLRERSALGVLAASCA
ncbi:HEAT repeat domain-containing protein [Quadrisphaera sp. INWT6]|uniref:HEAT repeat domain-containing protein n=1 Tax=Quadrisphaera sp. INWT6 TaxID=2596917 RepID=UPI0018925C98|nr:HEAT repeat domain-containing protein [Quadrisphaera sp. INWT6]MBF5081285.1 hypothetical protein [Quadrisphaera sp. INWT6]